MQGARPAPDERTCQMSMSQPERSQPGAERRAETESAAPEPTEHPRDKARRTGLHPSLRALPDYPAR